MLGLDRVLLDVNDQVRPPGKVILDAKRAAAVHPPPLRFVPLKPLPALPAPPIVEDLDSRVGCELALDCDPEIRLVSRHDDQVVYFFYAGSAHRCSPSRWELRKLG